MLNVHLRYKLPSSWRLIFWPGERPRHFSRLKKCRNLVNPREGGRTGGNIQVFLIRMGVLLNGKSCLKRKWGITVASVHAPIQRNIPYGQMVYLRDQMNRIPSLTNPPVQNNALMDLINIHVKGREFYTSEHEKLWEFQC